MPQKVRQHPEDNSKFQIEKKVNFWYDFDKNVPDLITIFKHTDRPIAVLGGAHTLPEDLKKIPKDCILISCNHHAFRLVEPDYMVFLDPRENNHSQIFKNTVNNPGKTKRISYVNLNHTDFYCINEAMFHDRSDTGVFATWVASYISTGDIYLCGITLRDQQHPMHFYDNPDTVTAWGGPSMDVKINRWRDVFKHVGVGRIKLVSEFLKHIFNA